MNRLEKILLSIQLKISSINVKTLSDIGKLTKKVKKTNPKDVNAIQDIYLETEVKANKAIDRINKYTNYIVKKSKNIFNSIARREYLKTKAFYMFRGKNFVDFKDHTKTQSIINNSYNAFTRDILNLSNTTGFKLLDRNKKVVHVPIKQAYRNVINQAVLQVQNGTLTYNEAIRNVLKQYADSGIRYVQYESGYSKRLDSAVRQNIIDTVKQIKQEIHLELGKEYEADGVEISTHMNCAPDHLPVQGHQFSNEEFSKMQSNMSFRDIKGNSYEAFKRQIGQWNCRHLAFPIIIGVTAPNKTDEELEKIKKKNNEVKVINGEEYTGYEATQEQRKMELKIRQSRERLKIFEETDDQIAINEAKKEVSRQIKVYKDFSQKANLSVKMENTKII